MKSLKKRLEFTRVSVEHLNTKNLQLFAIERQLISVFIYYSIFKQSVMSDSLLIPSHKQ